MATPEQEAPQDRKKRTVWLLAGGAASLLIPLAGAVYLHWSQNSGAAGPSGRSDVFERREGEDRKIIPTQSAVVTSPSALMAPPSGMAAGAGSSLDFIKSNADMQARVADPKAAAAVPAASTAPPVAAVPPPAPAAKPAKPGKKAFSMPKLQPSRGFTNFGSSGSKGGGGQSSPDALKNLPPGAENDPRVQAYLKSHPQGQ